MQHATTSSSASLPLWLNKPAPRYTSYPPAPFFHTGVTYRDYAHSLAALLHGQAVSLYIHIPFCTSLCLYCGCNTAITHRMDRIELYLAALKHEISLVANLTGRRPVSHVHFGGGTPNILSDRAIHDLFAFLRQHFDFSQPHDIAMELDPRSVTQSQVETLAACGVTRVSLGIQDFASDVQAIVHRHQPYALVAQVCGWLRDAGIRHINFDLMYGLPKQTAASVAATAEQACSLMPGRVALFSYAHVPEVKPHQRVLENYGLPEPHERLAFEQIARGILIGHGYYAIGIDHFARHDDSMMIAARAGKLHRNFQGYTEDESLILLGFGASSISQTPDGYFQNDRDEAHYEDSLTNGHLPIRRGFLLSPDDYVRRAIIEQLMCTLSCDIEAVCQRFHTPLANLTDELEQLHPYVDAGLIAQRGYVVCLTTPYRMAMRVICAVFDAYTDQHGLVLSSRTA